MSHDGREALPSDLENLGRRIAVRLRELKSAGRLQADFELTAHDIRVREQFLRERVADAIRSGKAADIVRAELASDYSALFDNAQEFETRIDREFAKGSD